MWDFRVGNLNFGGGILGLEIRIWGFRVWDFGGGILGVVGISEVEFLGFLEIGT